MTINFDGNIINFKQKIQELGRKRGSPVNEKRAESTTTKTQIVDIVKIKNENWLAANIDVKSEEEAKRVVEDLQNLFEKDSKKALLAHDNANADKVLKFYPFE
ncbi:conserved hypothetical protein [Deferribacter desulfuricans SSM1]|uniref:Uncharacterized protein n=1 Tax=Deferribacter desulfuricans (strain DSM 14783 / JCM 11476 / NBRC 101012 / SSM1) TaxID=639282 RepID=D3PBU2_DEFDS|nr:hypothetical protein [Deferribacter desulfuricans]BAI80065.1 conserved hypothetical protein [Deferribacter desulfuricans SSM1]